MLYSYKYKVIASCQTMLSYDGESCITLLHKVKYLFGIIPTETICLYSEMGISKDNTEKASKIATDDMIKNNIKASVIFDDAIINLYNR